MVGWYHRLNDGFGWTLGVGDEQGGLACCDSWGRKELDTTERLILSDTRVQVQVQLVGRQRYVDVPHRKNRLSVII